MNIYVDVLFNINARGGLAFNAIPKLQINGERKIKQAKDLINGI